MATFESPQPELPDILRQVNSGLIRIPEFQRGWVWTEDLIRSLIASVSQSFPIGTVMTLQTGGSMQFHERTVEGVPPSAATEETQFLILDGQQRITSLYQACFLNSPVETGTTRTTGKPGRRLWFYIDMEKALDPNVDREEAITSVPPDKHRKRTPTQTELDLSSPEKEYANRMFPVCKVLDAGAWQHRFVNHYMMKDPSKWEEISRFWEEFADSIVNTFKHYRIPLIRLPKETERHAVCLIFEKVNTKGQDLTIFELLTASYMVENFRLRDDWTARKERLNDNDKIERLLKNVEPDHFLKIISLLAKKSARRKDLFRLELKDYQDNADRAEDGLVKAAKFLVGMGIFEIKQVPYRYQIVPLAAILADLGRDAEKHSVQKNIQQWYWCGVFGQRYSGSADTQAARDFSEVPEWARDPEKNNTPEAVNDLVIRADIILSKRKKNSPLYKGVAALLMDAGTVRDWRSGKPYNIQVFFDENIDIHHIFPKAWCADQKYPLEVYDAIANKTPLSGTTNKILQKDAPSEYLKRLEDDKSGIPNRDLDDHLKSHQIDPELLRTNDFDGFIKARRQRLVELIQQATGNEVVWETNGQPETGVDEEDEDEEN